MQLRPRVVLCLRLARLLNRLFDPHRIGAQLITIVAAAYLARQLLQPLLQVWWGGNG
jgi:hypothetical protein